MQTLLTVGATLAGGVIAFIGAIYLQRRQDASAELERGRSAVAEILASAFDVLFGVRAIREAHARSTRPRFFLRLAAMLVRDFPQVQTLRELAEPYRTRPLIGTLLDAQKEQADQERLMAIDTANVLVPKMNRYFAVAALMTLGEDRVIADAVRDLTSKVTSLLEASGGKQQEVERLSKDLEAALENFRSIADQRLEPRPRLWRRLGRRAG